MYLWWHYFLYKEFKNHDEYKTQLKNQVWLRKQRLFRRWSVQQPSIKSKIHRGSWRHVPRYGLHHNYRQVCTKMAICHPQGRGTLRQSLLCGPRVLPKLSPSSYCVVPKLSQSFTKFSPSWPKSLPKLSPSCHKVVPELIQSCGYPTRPYLTWPNMHLKYRIYRIWAGQTEYPWKDHPECSSYLLTLCLYVLRLGCWSLWSQHMRP